MESPGSANGNDVSALHEALVEKLKSMGAISTAVVEAAFRAVPRHLFLPDVELQKVYSDEVIPTKRLDNEEVVSSSSQPAIMAIMLEQLALEPGQRVLEIGAGTGYNAALMAHIVADTGQVVAVDIDDDIVASAREHLAAAGFNRVQVVCRDGGFGFADAAPYDRIILTVGAADIAPAWHEQLKPGGRLVLPMSLIGFPQQSIAFEKTDDHLDSVSVKPCGFMPLRGAFAVQRDRYTELGPEPGLTLIIQNRDTIDAQATYQLLTGPSRVLSTDIRITPRELWSGLDLWLDLHEPNSCGLTASGEWVKRDVVPYLFGYSDKFCSTGGLIEDAQRCALMMRPPDQVPPVDFSADEPPFTLYVRSFGPDDTLAQRLIERVTAWHAAGRPAIEQLRIRAYPLDKEYVPSANECVVLKRSIRLVLEWQ